MAQQPPAPLSRVPPHSEEAERGVLGCAIGDPGHVMDLVIERGLRVESFYFPVHQRIWECLVEMHEKASQIIDPLTVTTRLRDKQVLEEVGGVSYIQSLLDAAPISAHAESYIELVRQKAILRTIIDNAREAVDKCYDPDRDVDLVLAETEQAFMNLEGGGAQIWRPWPGLVDDMMREINQLADSRQDLTGIPTGFTEIDRMLRGLQPADMIVLAARPSMGKTSLALNMAENIALGKGDPEHRRRAVAVFSLEMSAEALTRRMICCRARVSAGKIGGGYLSKEQHGKLMQAAQELKEAPIFIDDTAALDVMDMRARARRLKKKENIEFIVVDYLQIAHCAKYGKESWQREVGGISSEVKAMAKELKVPVLILSQLSRAAETRDRLGKPKLSDLRDSGSIEQDADVVFLLRRPSRYPDDPDHSDETLAIVDVAKHRNGATGELHLNFFGEYTRFENREHHANEHPIPGN